jgi:hypothetical protein
MASAWVASKRVPRFVTWQPRNSAFQCSATLKIQTLPCWTVVTWVASIAHIHSVHGGEMNRPGFVGGLPS